MKDNRRSFIKTLGLSSGALMVNQITSLQGKGTDLQEIEKNPEIHVRRKIDTDIVIAGGGMAGVCAALAAARNDLKVVLIQNRSRLGGNASSEIRMHICGATALTQVWRETGILEELMLTESATNPQVTYEMLDYVLYDKVISEKNITLLLDTNLFDVFTIGNKITSINAYCSQTEELYEISAKCFADCTGDGTMAAIAGAEFMHGREASSKWGESLGHEKPDDITMGNSLLFQARLYDRPMPFTAPSWSRKYTLKDFEHRKISSYEYGYWWLELGGVDDIINDGQQIRNDLMSVVFGVWDYIKNSGNHPDSINWALSSTRVMATCATLGQAAGTAMAFCLTKSLTPATLCADINHVHQLQQILLRQDQALLGVQNEDPDDLARSAAVRASDETIEGSAVNVIDGYNRNIMDGKSHQWQAAMKDDGAWIELAWDRSQNIGIIECTFDTGLHRFLRLSPELSVFRNQIRGPQPETIADYKIELKNKARIVYEK